MTSEANDPTASGRAPARARRASARRAALGVLGLAGAAAAALGGLALAGPGGGASGAGGLGWSWYKTDTHVHSSISGDAAPDLGIIGTNAKAAGYNALFLTDHNLASTFPVGAQTSVDVNLDDAMPRWFPLTLGAPTAMTNALEGAPAPAISGVLSLHLSATAAALGEASVWTKRGANLRSGDDVLTFSVQPKTALTATTGLYVSASLGGDPTVSPPPGYTTAGGVISPGKSKVFVYYFGAPPPASLYPGSQLFTFNLGAAPTIPGLFSCNHAPVVGQWTSCTINISKAVPLIPQAERPIDYNAFGDLKIAAVTQGGKVDAYFDAYRLLASAPADPAGEYVFRNSIVSQQDTADFKIYPSVELGIGDHVGRFDFGFSDPAGFRSYKNGIEGIAETHALGYPAQVDHPGVPGGVSDQEAIDNDAFGADAMEVRFQNMIDDWDQLLTKGLMLTGSWATDNHLGRWSAQSQATYIQAPTLGFDDLMRSFYEGRSYLAINAFSGQAIFGPDAASPDPHPARYPIFVSAGQTTAPAHLAVSGGIVPGSTVVWITNGGAVLGTDPAPAGSYDAVKQVPLSGPSTYVRVEVRDAMGIQDVMTQPIMWKQVPGLPAGVSIGVEGVTTPNGIGYTNVSARGATGATWDAANRALTATLDNPAGSLVELRATTAAQTPANVTAGGALVPRVGSAAEVQTAVGPAWAGDAATATVRARATQGVGPTPAVITFAGAGDVQAPAAPSSLVATPTGPTQVTLGWSAASDAVGVAAYDVYRNGVPIARLPTGTVAYVDDALGLGETHRYSVDAVDAAGNQSLQSNVVTVSTAPKGTPPPPPPPPPTTTTTGVTPQPPNSPLVVVQGAFRGAATQPHGEGFGVSLSLAIGRRAFELGGRALKPLRLVVAGQSIVQDPARARAVVRHSGLPGRRITVVSYGGTLYVARGSGAFRTAVGGLRTTLPPLVASGFGQSPARFPGGLVKLRDLGPIVVGVSGSRRYRAELTPTALKRYLSGLLVQGGLTTARAKALAAAARVTLNRVDLQVVSGQLDRVSISLNAALGPARSKAPGASIVVRANVDLNDYGAELAVRRPAAKGVASRLAQLR